MGNHEAQALAEKLLELSPLVGVIHEVCPSPVNQWDCFGPMPLDAVILHLNDEHHMSREDIAEWLDAVCVKAGVELKIYAHDDPECDKVNRILYNFKENRSCPVDDCERATMNCSMRSLAGHLRLRHGWSYGKVNNWVITQVKESLYEQG